MEIVEVAYLPVWRRYLDQFRRGNIQDQDLGALFRAMMEYQFEGVIPDHLSESLQIYWIFLQPDLDHARLQYETSVKNGKKGGRKKGATKKQEPEETQNDLSQTKSITESESLSESITKTNTISISNTSKEKEHTASGKEAAACVSVSKRIYGDYGWVSLSEQDYSLLEKDMGKGELELCIAYVDQYAQSTQNSKHWFNWPMVLRKCYRQGWHKGSLS